MVKKKKKTARRTQKQSMEEKGISPLIATVLLIGFTVALAAIIITWGGRFITDTTERVDTQTGAQLTCTDLDFKITDVICNDVVKKTRITVDNRVSIPIDSLTIRVHQGGEVKVTADVKSDGAALGAFNVGKFTADLVNGVISDVTKIEAIPKISVGDGKVQACDQIIEERTITDGCTLGSVGVCGDGVVNPGEECDNGDSNSDTTSDACRTNCVLHFCGDNVIDTGEACDDGASNSDTTSGACKTDCSGTV
jgi:flagellin-like protein